MLMLLLLFDVFVEDVVDDLVNDIVLILLMILLFDDLVVFVIIGNYISVV